MLRFEQWFINRIVSGPLLASAGKGAGVPILFIF